MPMSLAISTLSSSMRCRRPAFMCTPPTPRAATPMSTRISS
jgi:hypothetical protein